MAQLPPRHRLPIGLALAAVVWPAAFAMLGGCATSGPEAAGPGPAERQLLQRIDLALTKSAALLITRQSPDGAWRSEVYGLNKDGPSMTPHVASALFFLPQGGEAAGDAFERGLDYLVGLIGADGELRKDVELIYPVYTAAECSRMIAKAATSPQRVRAQAAWLKLIRSHQLTESRGWQEPDRDYGGWSFAMHPPRKSPLGGAQSQPEPLGPTRGPWDWSNLSVTIYGLATLRSAKVPADDPAYRQALVFVQRCQNFKFADSRPVDRAGGLGNTAHLECGTAASAVSPPEAGEPGASRPVTAEGGCATITAEGGCATITAEGGCATSFWGKVRCSVCNSTFDDGGFFFSPGEPIMNKAGVAGRDPAGRQRFNSYGSMTADGIRALLDCGLPADHPRVLAAYRWIGRNFSVEHNPGQYVPVNEDLRDAVYYYYCWSLAHALMRLDAGRRLIDTGYAAAAHTARVDWPVLLAEALLNRQRADGTWVNPLTEGKEDDPLVATPLAAAALAICRHVIAGGSQPASVCRPGGR